MSSVWFQQHGARRRPSKRSAPGIRSLRIAAGAASGGRSILAGSAAAMNDMQSMPTAWHCARTRTLLEQNISFATLPRS